MLPEPVSPLRRLRPQSPLCVDGFCDAAGVELWSPELERAGGKLPESHSQE